MSIVSFLKINIIIVFLDPKLVYMTIFTNFRACLTCVWHCVINCPFSWIDNERRINFKNICQVTMPHISIDLGAKYLLSSIIIPDFIVNSLILLFVSARYGLKLIIDDLSITTQFFKSEVEAKTMRKTTAKFHDNCSTPS